jgi:hypothetical protein
MAILRGEERQPKNFEEERPPSYSDDINVTGM